MSASCQYKRDIKLTVHVAPGRAERQLVELHRNENGRFANLLSMAAPLPSDYDTDSLSEQMGSPMRKRHSRRASDWSVSSQPEGAAAAAPANGAPASMSDPEAVSVPASAPAPAPKIQPVFRPIRSPAAAAQKPASAAAGGATGAGGAEAGAKDAAADGQDNQMVQILLQQVSALATRRGRQQCGGLCMHACMVCNVCMQMMWPLHKTPS